MKIDYEYKFNELKKQIEEDFEKSRLFIKEYRELSNYLCDKDLYFNSLDTYYVKRDLVENQIEKISEEQELIRYLKKEKKNEELKEKKSLKDIQNEKKEFKNDIKVIDRYLILIRKIKKIDGINSTAKKYLKTIRQIDR